MENLRNKIRNYKSRVPLDELYINIIEEIYHKDFVQGSYSYYFLITINIERVVRFAYNNYYIIWDNLKDITDNILEILCGKFIYIRCDENPPYRIKEYMILNSFHTKQSRLFNKVLETKPGYQNLIKGLVEDRLRDCIIDVNFIYTLLHPNSVLYHFIERFSYEEVLNKLEEYMIQNKIALKIEKIITNDIFVPIGLFNYPFYLEFYLDSIDEEIRLYDRNHKSDISLILYAFQEGIDILSQIFLEEQLSYTFIDDFIVNDKFMEYDPELLKIPD